MAEIPPANGLSGIEQVAMLILNLRDYLRQQHNSLQSTTPEVPQNEPPKERPDEPEDAENLSYEPETYSRTTMPYLDTAHYRNGHVMYGRPSSPQDQLGYGYLMHNPSLISQGTQPLCSPSNSVLSTTSRPHSPDTPILPPGMFLAEHSQNQPQNEYSAHHSSQAYNYLHPQDFYVTPGVRPYTLSTNVPNGNPSHSPINQHQSPSPTKYASIPPVSLPPIFAYASVHPHSQNQGGSNGNRISPLNRSGNGRCSQPTGSSATVGPIRNRIWAPHRQATCPECHATYTSSGHLQRHLETHGSGRRYKCDYCTCAYSRRERLSKHLDMAHGIKMTIRYSTVTPKPTNQRH